MVFLVLTRNGYEQLVKELGHTPKLLWVNANVLSAEEIGALRGNGHDVTFFTKPIELSSHSAIEDAEYTVKEHHPEEALFTEAVVSL